MTTLISRQETITVESQFLIQVGSVGGPGLAFLDDADTGLTQNGSGQVSLISNGSFRLTAAPNFISATVPFAAEEGVAGTGYVFKDGLNRDTGLFSDTPGEVGLASLGSEVLRITTSGVLTIDGANAQVVLPSHPAASLPTGTTGGMIFVPDESGGAVPAYFDGSDWRRVTDGAIVS